jgi:hypothetical protein
LSRSSFPFVVHNDDSSDSVLVESSASSSAFLFNVVCG